MFTGNAFRYFELNNNLSSRDDFGNVYFYISLKMWWAEGETIRPLVPRSLSFWLKIELLLTADVAAESVLTAAVKKLTYISFYLSIAQSIIIRGDDM